MTKNEFKQKTSSFIQELNNRLSIDCKLVFDENCKYPCCFNPESNSIILNYNLLNKTNQSALYYLGDKYLKYYLLHEYGHIVYNKQVKQLINNIINNETQNPTLTCFIQNYNFCIDNLSKLEPSFSISMDLEHFWAKQYSAACEFMADYFVIQQINKNLNYLNSTSFKLWRANEILEQYNHCHKNNWLHLEPLRYYHIPETILDKNINFINDSINNLINISLNNSLKSLILIYNQSNNPAEYNATNFDKKISSIIENFNKLRK